MISNHEYFCVLGYILFLNPTLISVPTDFNQDIFSQVNIEDFTFLLLLSFGFVL